MQENEIRNNAIGIIENFFKDLERCGVTFNLIAKAGMAPYFNHKHFDSMDCCWGRWMFHFSAPSKDGINYEEFEYDIDEIPTPFLVETAEYLEKNRQAIFEWHGK